MASEFLSSSLGAFDMVWAHTCRDQDMIHRKIENRRRAIDDARHILDKKVQQLKAISHLSALVAGFAMVVLVEATVPSTIPHTLQAAFGMTAAVVVGLLLMAMINCTLILVLILKHDCTKFDGDNTPSELLLDFWHKRCEDDFEASFKAFTLGVPFFLVNLILLGWVKFAQVPAAAGLITAVAVLAIVVWTTHTQRKWGSSAATTEPRTAGMGGEVGSASATGDYSAYGAASHDDGTGDYGSRGDVPYAADHATLEYDAEAGGETTGPPIEDRRAVQAAAVHGDARAGFHGVLDARRGPHV